MSDQVVMGPNGDLAIAVPLYRGHSINDTVTVLEGYTIAFTENKPLAFAIDLGEGNLHLVNAEMVTKKVTFLGDL